MPAAVATATVAEPVATRIKAAINHPDGQWNNLKYDLVGKQLQLRDERGGLTYTMAVRIQSATDTELVLEYRVGDKTREARYTREK